MMIGNVDFYGERAIKIESVSVSYDCCSVTNLEKQ